MNELCTDYYAGKLCSVGSLGISELQLASPLQLIVFIPGFWGLQNPIHYLV